MRPLGGLFASVGRFIRVGCPICIPPEHAVTSVRAAFSYETVRVYLRSLGGLFTSVGGSICVRWAVYLRAVGYLHTSGAGRHFCEGGVLVRDSQINRSGYVALGSALDSADAPEEVDTTHTHKICI